MKRLLSTVLLFLFCLILNAGASEPDIHIYSRFDLFKSNHSRQKDLSSGWEMRNKDKGQWEGIETLQPLPVNEQFEFRKFFTLDSSDLGKKYQLEINGLYGSCAVYLNSKLLGTHQGSVPVLLQIPPNLVSFDGTNKISVQMNNVVDYKSSLPLKYRAGGIPLLSHAFSPRIILWALPESFVSKAHLAAFKENRQSVLRLNVQISHPPLKLQVRSRWNRRYLRIQIMDKENSVPVWKSEVLHPLRIAEKETEFQMNIPTSRIKFWEIGVPHNYLLKFNFRSQGQSEEICSFPFAIRKQPGNPFLSLQADSVKKMKCIEWIADKKFAFKSEREKRKQIESDLTSIRELHANSVRVFASAPKPFFLDMCDSLGLGVLVEIPLCNAPPRIIARSDFQNKAGNLLKEWIQAFQSHPSVIAWGVGSGFIGNDLRTINFVDHLKRIATKWDDRPLYAGVVAGKKLIPDLAVDFRILKIPIDRASTPIAHFSRYLTSDKNIIRISIPLAYQKKNVQAVEREQAYKLQEALNKIMKSKTAAGVIVTPLRDWAGETPHLLWGPRRGANIFPAGLLDITNKTRPAFDVVKSVFEDKKNTDHPFVRQSTETIIFEIIGFIVLLIFLMFVRSDRVFRNYLRRIFLFPHGFYMDMSENRRVSSLLTALVGTTSIVTLSLVLASYVYFLRSSSSFDNILTWLFANPQFKYKVIWLIWHPLILTLFFIALLFLLSLLQSVVFKIITFFQHRFIKLTQLFTFVLWLPANLLFAAPIAIVLYRLLERSSFVQPVSVLLLIIFLWTILRIFRGTKVILQITNFQTFILYIFVLGVFIAAYGGHLEYHRSLLAYTGYFMSVLGF
ncbi:MAG: hypothetical protein GXO75_03520 [Calditrichaeota bacterium]|nr:hypothetical protein [Calditrichota bacterium]